MRLRAAVGAGDEDNPPEDPVGMCARHKAGALRSRVTAAQLSEAPYPFANEIRRIGV
jgi:hypothetical protein